MGLGAIACAFTAPAAAGADMAPLMRALELGGYSPGERPPAFAGLTVHGKSLGLADLEGKVVILNFWATWCPPCRVEMPQLESLQRRLGVEDLAVVAINVSEPAAPIRGYADGLGLTVSILLDPAGEIRRAYGVIGLPTTFLVGRNGRAVARAIGPRDWGSAHAQRLLRMLVDEPAPRTGAVRRP